MKIIFCSTITSANRYLFLLHQTQIILSRACTEYISDLSCKSYIQTIYTMTQQITLKAAIPSIPRSISMKRTLPYSRSHPII